MSQMSNHTKPITRRQFLRITAFTAAAGLAWKTGAEWMNEPEPVTETRLLIGTVVNLTVVGPDQAASRRAIVTCLDRMEQLENVLSRFKPESQLTQLNRTGTVENADPALRTLVRLAHDVSEQSSGAFDITIKPLVDLYTQAQQSNGTLPSAEMIEATRQRVDYRQLQVDGTTVAFSQPDMAITLDGIAKGYIVDEGIALLREQGLTNVIVEAGGDLLAAGRKTTGTPWQIGVQSPRAEQSGYLARVRVENQAIATSGDYMQPYSADFKHHHIIDPRTGYSSPELAGVTVLAPDTAQADALATAAMVLGPDAGQALIKQLPGCEALFVTKTLDIVTTSGFNV